MVFKAIFNNISAISLVLFVDLMVANICLLAQLTRRQ
jgi:hypothetical protein